MGKEGADGSRSQAVSALALMEQALGLLDEADFAHEAGADLDLAICRLRNALEGRRGEGFAIGGPAALQPPSDTHPSPRKA